MPVLRFNDKKLAKYRIHFFSYDCTEKMHVHVHRDANKAKFWVTYDEKTDTTTLTLHSKKNYSDKELHSLSQILKHHGKTISDQWNDHCKDYGDRSIKHSDIAS